jgi:hypothetical protein
MKTHAVKENRTMRPAEALLFFVMMTLLAFNLLNSSVLPGAWLNKLYPATPVAVEMPVLNAGHDASVYPTLPGVMEEALAEASALFTPLSRDVAKPLHESKLATANTMVMEVILENQTLLTGMYAEAASLEIAGKLAGTENAVTAASGLGAALMEHESDLHLTLESWMISNSCWSISEGSGLYGMEALDATTHSGFDCQSFLMNLINFRNGNFIHEEDVPLKIESWMTNESFFRGASESGAKVPEH